MVEISQKFVAFWEYMNFINTKTYDILAKINVESIR